MKNHAQLLHHFCPQHAIDGIRKTGITKGSLPWNRDKNGQPQMIRDMRETSWTAEQIAIHREKEARIERLLEESRKLPLATNAADHIALLERTKDIRTPGFQWLTTNPSFEQPWCFLGNLDFPKNAYRITVLIPPKAAVKPFLLEWPDLCKRCRPDSALELNINAVDWENWRLFYGAIPPSWFLEVVRNVGQQIIATEHGGG